jgi:hypothetical protein
MCYKNTDLSISALDNNSDWSHDIAIITQLIPYNQIYASQ